MKLLTIITATTITSVACGAELHVAITGNDANAGSVAAPLRTIQHAAGLAQPGDVITVHQGVYRERVAPPRSGASDSARITYRAAPGEKVVLTGSEPAKGWKKVTGDTWALTLTNSYFGSFNPFGEFVSGDFFSPKVRIHRASVYLNNDWLTETNNLDAVMKPAAKTPLWFAQVDGTKSASNNTVIYGQFPGIDPNSAQVEISVRPTVFTPEKTNINYITVRGFELCNAATTWAAPTAGQVGLVTAYWCKGWIIENNEIHHSRCCGIALGKYSDEWDGHRGTTEGYHLTIKDALNKGGWTRDQIGGHIVRGNHIHHCGQTGIVGSLGCAFSRVENNEIHDIHFGNPFLGGAEMAGIKLHGAIDVVISGNHIYRCGVVGGLWLDWMAQGTQVTGNLFHDNDSFDIFTEVNHGPFLIANNILLSPGAYASNSQGGAYAHNLITGSLRINPNGRRTPYHIAHSTEMAGVYTCPVGDVHWHNNILAGRCNMNAFNKASWPVRSTGNVFAIAAQPSKFEKAALVKSGFDASAKLEERPDGWYLTIVEDEAWGKETKRKLVTTDLLGKATIPKMSFEQPDGSPIQIDTDYLGKKRGADNPFPGPLEISRSGKQTIKVWPKP